MTTHHSAARTGRKIPPGALKAYIASLTGTSLEYYDFAIYSVASALVFPKIFFPGNDEFVGLLLSFSAFAVGYLARPIGGVIFGRLGDKIGRKHVLVVTLMLIGVATVLIGLLPDYSVIGVAAPPSWCSCAWPRASASAANGAVPSCSPANSVMRTSAASGPPRPRSARPPAT